MVLPRRGEKKKGMDRTAKTESRKSYTLQYKHRPKEAKKGGGLVVKGSRKENSTSV